MSPLLNTLVFLVLLPLGLFALARRAPWPFYRSMIGVVAALWFLGVGLLSLLNTTCAGNLFHGYHSCAVIPQGLTQTMIGLGGMSLLVALVFFIGLTLALLIRTLARKR